MSKFLLTFVLLLSFFVTDSNLSYSEEKSSKIGVIINYASWCPACQANGKRVKMKVFSKFMNTKNVEIILNDLSDEKTITKSQKKLTSLGLSDFTKNNKSTGTIYFVDLSTKKVINTTNVTKTNEELIKEFNMYLKN